MELTANNEYFQGFPLVPLGKTDLEEMQTLSWEEP